MRVYLDNCCFNRPYDDQSQVGNRERFDYTKWQRDYFDRMTPEELMERAVQFSKEHPFQGKKAKILSAES